MIRKILLNDVLLQLDKRDALRAEARKLRQEHGEGSSAYRDGMDALRKQADPPLYLAGDTRSIGLAGGFKSGKELDRETAERLIELGYSVVWGSTAKHEENDKPEPGSFQAHLQYRSMIEELIARCLLPFNEQEIRKPNSSIKILEGDDLTRISPDGLQMDGARLVFEQTLGKSAKKLANLWGYIRKYLKEAPRRLPLGDNISIGNEYTVKPGEERKDIEPTNFFLKTSVSTGLLVAKMLGHLQKVRVTRGDTIPKDHKIEITKRYPYDDDALKEHITAAFLTDYGFIHGVVMQNIKRETQPLLSPDGERVGSGFRELSETAELMTNRHGNVAANILSSARDPEFIHEATEDMIRYHHRGLHGGGYPKRKLVSEHIQVEDEGHSSHRETRQIWDQPITEVTRIVGLANSFIEYLYGTPWRLPIERDSLVRYYEQNAVFPKNAQHKDDTEGHDDLNTHLIYEKRFDAYLVKEMLGLVELFQTGEQVPLYNRQAMDQPAGIATVVEPTDKPHRPVIKVVWQEGGEDQLDLSDAAQDEWFLGEFHPTLAMRSVERRLSPGSTRAMYIPPEDMVEVEDGATKPKSKEEWEEEQRRNAAIDAALGKQPAAKLDAPASDESFNLDAFLQKTRGKSTDEPAAAPAPTEAPAPAEPAQSSPATPTDSPSNLAYALVQEVDLMKPNAGDIVYIHYVEAVHKGQASFESLPEDQRRGQIKYIGRVNTLGDTPRVTFLRYLPSPDAQGNQVTRDKNCGKEIDLGKYPFFKMGRLLTGTELERHLSLNL